MLIIMDITYNIPFKAFHVYFETECLCYIIQLDFVVCNFNGFIISDIYLLYCNNFSIITHRSKRSSAVNMNDNYYKEVTSLEDKL